MSPWIPNATIAQSNPDPSGWVSDAPFSWAFATANTFTVSGDQRQKFSKGTRVKLTQTTVKYFVVYASSFGAGVTTVYITAGDDFTFANASVSDNYYSYAINPQGYPGWFIYSPTQTGFSSAPSFSARFHVLGKLCSVWFDNGATPGTSNLTTFTVSLPINAANDLVPYVIQHADNGVASTSPGMARTQADATLNLYTNLNAAAWTASGTKWARFFISYEYHFV